MASFANHQVESFSKHYKESFFNKEFSSFQVLSQVLFASKSWVEAELSKQGKWEADLATSEGRVV